MEYGWKKVSKILLDALALFVFGLPAMVVGYIWRAVSAGWAMGEWAFDPDAFHRRYGGKEKAEELMRGLRESMKR